MLRKLLSPVILVFVLGGLSLAQENPQNPPPNDERPNVLAQLGLSTDQVQQFRRVNAEHRPQMQAAQQRLREANRDLDIAIYSDSVSEEVFQARLRAFQEAQGEVTRLRFQNELAIRKILTPDQLTRFREIRRRFMNARDFIQQRRQQRRQIRDGIKRRNQNDQQKRPQGNPLKQNRRGE
ncbi:MAG TPA: periplasmic heavy metal sensor [Pyrinomonadaceae bacterium]|nr:periplasmic heavy metal sensor [Pyrinomonadaceae bacterium]